MQFSKRDILRAAVLADPYLLDEDFFDDEMLVEWTKTHVSIYDGDYVVLRAEYTHSDLLDALDSWASSDTYTVYTVEEITNKLDLSVAIPIIAKSYLSLAGDTRLINVSISHKDVQLGYVLITEQGVRVIHLRGASMEEFKDLLIKVAQSAAFSEANETGTLRDYQEATALRWFSIDSPEQRIQLLSDFVWKNESLEAKYTDDKTLVAVVADEEFTLEQLPDHKPNRPFTPIIH